MAIFEASDFGAGIFRARKAPPNSVYDALNALVTDEGELAKRGLTGFYSASNVSSGTPLYVHALHMPAIGGHRILAAVPGGSLYALNGGLNPVATGTVPSTWSRPATVNDMAVFASAGSSNFLFYGGSLKGNSVYGTGTVALTNGSAAVTGAGTAWLANVDPGMILVPNSGVGSGVVKKVTSDTQLELMAPWGFATAAAATYNLWPFFAMGTSAVLGGADATATLRPFVAAASQTLFYAVGNRVYFAPADDPTGFTAAGYHELPSAVTIVGLESRGTSLVVFTTGGVWTIENVYLDPVDDFGNVQRPVEQVNKDMVLWDDFGVAAWDAGIVVPAIDDVYLLGPDYGVQTLSVGIRPRWRAYVKAGYQLGLAAIHRGHYIVSVLNGSTVVDTLICRLDRPANGIVPWTRWAGHASGPSYVSFSASSSRSPKLLGLSGQRVTDLTGCMDVTSATTQDADATTPVFRVDENDIDTGPGIRPNTTEKVRYIYETTGGTPTINVSYATGPEGSSYTAATPKRGGGASTGVDYSAWKVSKKAERIRFRFECTSQVNSLILRRREATIRQQAQN